MGYTWILDNGHGALNKHNRSPQLEDGSFMYEYEFNRAIVERLLKLCKDAGIVTVDLVPDYNEVSNFVMGRIARANKLMGRAIYLSIHADAAPSGLCDKEGWCDKVHGSTVYFDSSKGMAIGKKFAENLASLFKNKGIKRRTNQSGGQYYAVLRETKMTALIIELGFMTNKEEVTKLMDPLFRDEIAKNLFATIKSIEDA